MQQSDNRRDRKKVRKPYVPPRVVEQASFEGLALGCAQFTDDACGVARS